MDLQEWKDGIIDKSKRQISYRSNMSNMDISDLTLVLSDFLSNGMKILKKWRKLDNDEQFLSGEYDTALIDYLKNSFQANNRELFSDYNVGGIRAKMDRTPESVLKSSCKQVM